jgi:hypothetical protein
MWRYGTSSGPSTILVQTGSRRCYQVFQQPFGNWSSRLSSELWIRFV